MNDTPPETVGQRLYLIRLAWGDGARKAESMKAYSARVEEKTGVRVDPMTLSLLERMEQEWTLAYVELFASVDKLNRPPQWLAFGERRLVDRHPLAGTRATDPRPPMQTSEAPAPVEAAPRKKRRPA